VRVLAVILMLLPMPAGAACRLALALALDVSGSVDAGEYRLQLDGLAAALADPDVEAALFAMPEAPVAMAVYEWSSARYQRVIQGWTVIDGPAALADVRQRLMSWQRTPAPETTGLGAAMAFGKALLDTAPPCWSRTLDVSGDGKNNDWPSPQQARAGGGLSGIRINGLVIAEGAAGRPSALEDLAAYFTARVIQGPDAFVERAAGYADYAAAMRRKLLRELKASPVGQAPTGGPESIVPAALRFGQ